MSLCINKIHPTINSTCTISILKFNILDQNNLDSDYFFNLIKSNEKVEKNKDEFIHEKLSSIKEDDPSTNISSHEKSSSGISSSDKTSSEKEKNIKEDDSSTNMSPLEKSSNLSSSIITINLEQVHTCLDIEFMKFLLYTKLEEIQIFHSKQITIEFQILKIMKHSPIYKLNNEQKINKSKLFKEKGIELFQQKKYDQSFYKFQQGIKYLIFCNKKNMSEDIKKLWSDLYVDICNNLALIHMKCNNYISSELLCNKLLGIDSNNIKALYRRSCCFIEMKNYSQANKYIQIGLSLEPNNLCFKKQNQEIQKQLKLENDSYKNIVKNMFK